MWVAPSGRAGDEVPTTQDAAQAGPPGKLMVTVGKSLIIDSPMKIQRISVANGDLVEAVAVNPNEVLINGKAAGETSLIVWQEGGNRLLYDLTVRLSPARLDVVRQQLARDFPKEDINVTFENDTAFVRGTVKDVTAADRVMAITASLGKSVNLLRVEVPPVEEQILLKVRFCNVDRGASTDLGVSFASGAFNQSTAISTGQFPAPSVGHQRQHQPFRRAQRAVVPQGYQPRRHRSRRWRPSACWRPWPSRTCWRSTASWPASWRAANFPFR